MSKTSKKQPIFKRDYLSDIDKFLTDFDAKHHKLSDSQKQEIVKFQKIYAQRDKRRAANVEGPELWEGF